MLLDLEKFKQAVSQKLDSKNLSFDDNDLVILNSDDTLRAKLFEVLKNNPNLFTYDIARIIDTFDSFEEILLNDDTLLSLYVKALLPGEDYFIITDVREFASEEVCVQALKDFFEFMENDDIPKSNGYVNDELVNIILDNKKYSYFESITRCNELSMDTIEKLREYAQEVNTVPDFLAPYYDKLKIDYSKYSLNALIIIFGEAAKPNSVIDVDKQDELNTIYKLIVDKLRAGEVIEKKIFKENLSSIFLDYDENNKRELVEILIQMHGTNSTIMTAISDEFDEYADLIINNITPESELKSFYVFDTLFLNNTRLVERLIECGHLDLASASSIFDKYLPTIIDKIKNGDPIYQNRIYDCNLIFSPELLEILLENNMVRNMRVDSSMILPNSKLREVILNKIKNGQTITLAEACYSYRDILDIVIQSKNFATLEKTNLNILQNAILSEESINILIEELKNNLKLTEQLLKSARSLIFQNQTLLNFYLQSNEYIIEKVIDRINHEESLEYLYNEENYNLIKQYYAKKYSLNINHLDLMCTKFGPRIIRYFDVKNIHQLVNLSDFEFQMFMELFPNTKISLDDISNIYDSVMQYKFSKENVKVVNIFADIMHSLEDNDNIYIQRLEDLYTVLDDKFYSKFEGTYPHLINEFKSNPKQFLLTIVSNIQNKTSQRDNCIDILHFITNYYIATQREMYRTKCNMGNDLNLPYDLEENALEKGLILICLNSSRERTLIREELTKKGLSLELAERCILYYLSKKDKSSKLNDVEVRLLNENRIMFSLEETKEIKQHLRELSLICKEYVKTTPYRDSYIYNLDSQCLVERIYRVSEDIPDIYQLLSGINVNALRHTLGNPKAYQSLLQTMHKYKMHLIPKDFYQLLESQYIDIDGNYSNLGSFISYYAKIYETEKARLDSQGKLSNTVMLKPVNIFVYGEVYSSVSSVYSQVLTSKDARLIKANPGPNAAVRKNSGNTRLNEAVERTIDNFMRMKVTIPGFAENVTLSDGKEMYVVAGNFTNPSNITHGERTGACMRIGGVGETLFQFCLENENGFHIRFENPITGEYISRVSGFRNGNTVFLNELRDSCNSNDYSNADVVEACRKAAELLIERSKDSTCPIENIVVHTAYALAYGQYERTDLGVQNIKVGLPTFYSDVSNSAHVLATTAEDKTFVPVNFAKTQVPIYLPAREKAKESTELKEIVDMINRVTGVKHLLAGQPLETIEPVINDSQFIYGIASQDWYIYIDNNFEVHEDIITIDSRAQAELDIARKRVAEMLPVMEMQQEYSY